MIYLWAVACVTIIPFLGGWIYDKGRASRNGDKAWAEYEARNRRF